MDLFWSYCVYFETIFYGEKHHYMFSLSKSCVSHYKKKLQYWNDQHDNVNNGWLGIFCWSSSLGHSLLTFNGFDVTGSELTGWADTTGVCCCDCSVFGGGCEMSGSPCPVILTSTYWKIFKFPNGISALKNINHMKQKSG